MQKYQEKNSLAVVLSDDAIQQLLLGRMKSAALNLVTTLFEQDVERLCGTKFSHKSGSQFLRGGSELTSVVVAGAKHPVRRPRVRGVKGEVALPSYQTLKSGDILDERMLTHMVEGVSTRGYERVAEAYADRFGISKSSVSKSFVRSSQKDLEAINGADLSKHRFLALMIDGIEFAKRVIVVAIGVDELGEKIVLGLREGSTENAEVVSALMENVLQRNFTLSSEKILCCLDGAKALKKAVVHAFGDKALIQRCYLHKIRNLKGHLPDESHSEMVRRIKLIMGLNRLEDAQEALTKLQDWIDTINSDAASSLREVGDDLLTVHRLGITGALRKSLASTNLIESIFSVVRTKCQRVKNWKKSPGARSRWVASAIVSHKQNMRKVKGVNQLNELSVSLNQIAEKRKVV